MDKSKNFNPGLIKKFVESWNEGPRLDFKSRLYSCENDEQKGEIAKDLIAFANVARRTGKPCYIVFGVDEESQPRKLCDVRNQTLTKNPVNPEIFAQHNIHHIQTEYVEKNFSCFAEQWIGPETPNFSLEYGVVDGVFISYLIIHPTFSENPFFLKKKFKSFPVNTVFVRKNSSCVYISNPHANQNLLSRSEAEYLSSNEWQRLIHYHLTGDFENFSTSPSMVNLRCNNSNGDDALLCLKNLYSSGEKIIIITGEPGSGKSILLFWFIYFLASQHNFSTLTQNPYFGIGVESNEDFIDEIDLLECIPFFPIPIYFSLRTTIESQHDIQEQIGHRISNILSRPENISLQKLFRIPGSKWVICLDAIDEIRNPQGGPFIRTWINNLPQNVSVVISSREYSIEGINEYKRIVISKPSREEIKCYINRRIQSEINDLPENFQTAIENWLEENPDIFEVLISYRALNAFFMSFIQKSYQDKPTQDISRVAVQPDTQDLALPKGDKELPVIVNDEILGDESQLANDLESREIHEEQSFYSFPRLAIVIKTVIDYIEDEEINRQLDFLSEVKNLAMDSRSDLKNICWKDWQHDYFNYVYCMERSLIQRKTLEWNYHIGFIRKSTENARIYHYYCDLFGKYLAAEYGFEKYEYDKENILIHIGSQDLNLNHTRKVINLFQDLLLENGKEAIIF